MLKIEKIIEKAKGVEKPEIVTKFKINPGLRVVTSAGVTAFNPQ
ncbi:MAG: hypothetical protein NTZ97_01205 [Candidatus Moranbacteria bacterium]|nr:hypothetical protein [Candidatus Moranbacteria bacterium]